MTLIAPVLIAFAVIVVAGGSLRRKGRLTEGTYRLWIVVGALVCLAVAALIFLPRSTAR